jgi:hypothetical protein
MVFSSSNNKRKFLLWWDDDNEQEQEDENNDNHDDIEDEEDEEEDRLEFQQFESHCILLTAAMTAFVASSERARSPMYVRDRLRWSEHVEELCQEGDLAFRRLYRMTPESFNKLCNLIRPLMPINEDMSKRRTGKDPISVEMSLHCVLRFLAGASPLDIRLVVGISFPSFYRVVYRCIDAILRVDELAYHFPSTDDDILQAARGFSLVSSHNIVQGCVACVDGMLLRIDTPCQSETGNVKSYFSGHYQDYGINVQAACDSQCRFVYCALAAPGGANDIFAYRQSTLEKHVEKLPLGKYVIGDNAYVCTEHLLTPFAGDEKKDPSNDAYNFFISQCRIRIEMAFGRLVNKFRIFRKPLEIKLDNIGRVFLCATRLHNFCINEKLLEDEDPSIAYAAQGQSAQELHYVPSTIEVSTVKGNSVMRDFLVNKIKSNSLRRPIYNTTRNHDREDL